MCNALARKHMAFNHMHLSNQLDTARADAEGPTPAGPNPLLPTAEQHTLSLKAVPHAPARQATAVTADAAQKQRCTQLKGLDSFRTKKIRRSTKVASAPKHNT
jgi:hypothetical protein